MAEWIDVNVRLPDEKEEVSIRVHGRVRPHYYQIQGRWYAAEDLERWKMNTSPYWKSDRTWYLKTEQVECWKPMNDQTLQPQGNGISLPSSKEKLHN